MVIRFMKQIKNRRISDGIMELLTLCSHEFVPPLSCRNSTTQILLSGKTEDSSVPYEYFENIRVQAAFVATENGNVIGFMSFKKNYVSSEIPPSTTPNIYITTVIVHPHYRNQGVTNRMYSALLEKFAGYSIFTRTWSTNVSHTRILSSRKFYEYRRLENDRGDGIDTVYYYHAPVSRTKLQIIRQYRLTGNFFFLSLLTILTAVFLVTWMLTEGGIIHELSIAFSTSLLASALCLFSDVILKYRESKNDEYINTLKSFGIENLQFHKDELLEDIIPKCSDEIWISGYRLIMTSKSSFIDALVSACRNHPKLKIKVLTVAPWSETFRLVYGNEDVSDNYLKVFFSLCRCAEEYGTRLEIRMTEKPIFNDTYKVDERFVTGPYLHCMNKNNMKIAAKDFFSLDINDPRKQLYDIVSKDYTAVWDSAPYMFDCSGFCDECKSKKDMIQKYSKEEKLGLLKRRCSFLTSDIDTHITRKTSDEFASAVKD